jgi:ABC-type multidrug transport system fused ATPase/permease subunit
VRPVSSKFSSLVLLADQTCHSSQVNAAIEKILETKEITVILVAHRLSSIAQADRVVVVDRGEIVEDGQFDDLINEPTSRFAKLMSAQLVGMHTPHE